jgi:biopolymer transport protein ExbD
MARKMRSSEEVELNLASMLDMAFQLLAFFILTFQPPPAEMQILMRMPPAQAVLGGGTQAAGSDETKKPEEVKPVKTLLVTVLAAENGGIMAPMQVGVPGQKEGLANIPVDKELNALTNELDKYFKGSADAFDQVIVQASPELCYGELMRVVEVCSKQKFSDGTLLKKLSFVALPSNPGSGGGT